MKIVLIISLLLWAACNPEIDKTTISINTTTPKVEEELNRQIIQSGNTIQDRILPPKNYVRTKVQTHSFAAYLRNLKLKPKGTKVKYYNGAYKTVDGVYQEVVDLEIGQKDLHQCADAIMRLRAEYLWEKQAYDKIHFNFTNGFQVDYTEWMKGRRMVIKGNETYWNDRQQPSNTYEDFWKYMELIFAYAGTASLEKELQKVKIEKAEIGDVLIQGGYPGHAVIIVDKAINPQGNPVYLLAQSYMPAQEIQILINPNSNSLNPWYELKEGMIYTPEWTFKSSNLKQFEE